MSALSLAIIGKNQEPLFIKEFFDESSNDVFPEEELFGLKPSASAPPKSADIISLRQQFILHAALDRFEQLAGPPPGYGWRQQGTSGSDAMFVGLLSPVEDMRCYGFMTTTHIKFLLVVEDDAAVGDQRTVDETIKRLFVKIHRLYVEYILNPFSPLNAPITSKRFNDKVKECVAAYNRTIT